MTPRTRYRADVEGEDLTVHDRPYESFGQQGFAMPDHVPSSRSHDDAADRGAENVELGERLPTAAGPRNWQRKDERIHDDVCVRLTEDPWVDASDVEVIVHHGEVTLAGTVPAPDQRARALAIVESVRGVVDVVSRVRVRAREVRDGSPRR